MIDPLPKPPIFVRDAVQTVADATGLRTLPLHVHELILSFAFYMIMNNYVAPILSSTLFSRAYSKFSARTKLNWDIHIVSLVQSSVICSLAFWIILADEDRRSMDAYERIWGYSGATGMVQALAAGYFAWDVWVSSRNLHILGLGSLAHAIGALIIVSLGFVRHPQMQIQFEETWPRT